MRRVWTLCLAIVIGGALTPAAADAQSTILRISREAAREMERRGWELISYFDGDLNHRRNLDHSVQVPANSEFAFVGVCDDDCSQLYLTVKSGSIKLGETRTSTDAPVVSVAGWGAGVRTVNVSMMSCSRNPCGYRVMLFVK